MDGITTEYDAVMDKHTMTQTVVASAEDLLRTLLTGLMRAQERRAAEVRVVEARRTLGVRERENAAGSASRDAWWVRMREVEIKGTSCGCWRGRLGTAMPRGCVCLFRSYFCCHTLTLFLVHPCADL